jgi:hypothetical protein
MATGNICICESCQDAFDTEDVLRHAPGYYEFPWNYAESDDRYCLACWLGVDPEDLSNKESVATA